MFKMSIQNNKDDLLYLIHLNELTPDSTCGQEEMGKNMIFFLW